MKESMLLMETACAGWSEQEQAIAREAFDAAYGRAVKRLIASLRLQIAELDGMESVWRLHDFLSIQRHELEGRFDDRLPGLLFVFAGLVKDSLLDLEDLSGLDALKLAKISAMSQM